jgi:hypothetical protein
MENSQQLYQQNSKGFHPVATARNPEQLLLA